MAKYTTERAHAFHALSKGNAESEIRAGNTISLIHEVDLSQIEAIRGRGVKGSRPTYTAFVVKAVAKALKAYPYANRRLYRPLGLPFLPLRLQNFHSCDLAVACERNGEGLPPVATFFDVVRDADERSLRSITAWLRDLGRADESNNAQWRAYLRLATRLPSWLANMIIHLPFFYPKLWSRFRGGSVVISAPTKYGVDTLVGAWMAPLGVSYGVVKERPVVRQGQVVARTTFNFLLNFDRRVMAGAQAARFFACIVRLLENAETELLEQEDRQTWAVADPEDDSRQALSCVV